MPKYEFQGWLDESEKWLFTKPWEKFQVSLYSNQSGDVILDENSIEKVLKASGYRLVLEKISNA